MSQYPQPEPPVERRDTVHVEERKVATGTTVATPPPPPPVAPVEETEHVVETPAGVAVQEHAMRDAGGYEHAERFTRDVATERRVAVTTAVRVTWFLVGVVEVAIGLRVLFRLIGANQAAGFTQFIYGVSAPFVAPFLAVTGSPGVGTVVFEVPSVIAMIVYLILGWLITWAIVLIFDQPTTRSTSTYRRFRG